MRLFAQGADGLLVTNYRAHRGPAAFYGVHPTLVPVWQQIQASGETFYYMDNAYFGQRKYYRVTRNALQCSGHGEPDWTRYDRLNVTFSPWRKSGAHILVCPHTDYFHEQMLGEPVGQWIKRTLRTLRAHTDRDLVVRRKPKRTAVHPISLLLRECWALVTPQSNAAIDALLAGVPVFTTGQSAANPMACRDLTQIESPCYPDNREEWAAVLAANQWTVAEMQAGICWRDLASVSGTN